MTLMSVAIERYRFTVDAYHRLGEAGILGEDDRVELIEGEITMMSPVGGRHAACVSRLTRLFVQQTGERAIVRVQDPVHLDERSEPQPDLAVLRPRQDFYASGHPRPEDVLLLVEVADSSLGYDRDVKLPLYGRAGIRELWIVDLDGEAIEVYRQPGRRGYAEVRSCRRGETVRASGVAVEVEVGEVLPGRA